MTIEEEVLKIQKKISKITTNDNKVSFQKDLIFKLWEFPKK